MHIRLWLTLAMLSLLMMGSAPSALASDPVSGPTYYVSTTGQDTNPGTVDQPWRTVKKGLTSLSAGDTLIIRGGVYNERIQSPTVRAGTSDQRVTVKAFPGERPIVQGLLWLRNTHHWTFDGVNVTWDDATGLPNEHMVKFTDGIGWTFTNGEIWGAKSYAGVLITGTGTGQPSNWALTGNCIHDTVSTNALNQDHNIYVNSGLGAGPGLIERNLVFNAPNGQAVKLGGPSSVSGGTANVTVRFNTMYNSNQNVLVAWQSSNNSLHRNIVGRTSGSYANIRGLQVTGEGNTATDNIGFAAGSLLKNDTGYPGIQDRGGAFPIDPLFDNTSSCSGFVPQNEQLKPYGRYGDAALDPLPPADPPPTVTGRSPADKATGVAVSTNVTATFSEAVQGLSTGTFTLKNAAGTAIAATVTYDATTRVATLDPGADLPAGATYTATLTGGPSAVRDTAGNALASTSWYFTTVGAADTTPPTVTGRTPAAGATGITVGSNVTATFSEAVQGLSTGTFTLKDAAGATVPAAVGYDATTRVATLDPGTDLPAGTTYTATLAGGTSAVRDTAGNALASTSWTFTTASAADTTAPTVTGRAPAAGATGVTTGSNVTATFSEAVQGVSGSTFTLKNAAGTAIAATVTYDAASRVATVNPSADLAGDTKYTATLAGGTTAIRDTANNALATQSWTFLTGPAPTVTARTPAGGATGVSRTGNITATFSEGVQGVSTSTFTLKNSAGTTITATIVYNATTRVATLDPGSTLAAGTTYTARLTGGATAIRDPAGNPLSTTSWTFTTSK